MMPALPFFPTSYRRKSEFVEGAAVQVMVNRYERDRRAREAALRYHGPPSAMCAALIWLSATVISAVALSTFIIWCRYRRLNRTIVWIRKTDLIPVCPNCHAMLHRRNPPYTPDELKKL